jgi:hypothetical protein
MIQPEARMAILRAVPRRTRRHYRNVLNPERLTIGKPEYQRNPEKFGKKMKEMLHGYRQSLSFQWMVTTISLSP